MMGHDRVIVSNKISPVDRRFAEYTRGVDESRTGEQIATDIDRMLLA